MKQPISATGTDSAQIRQHAAGFSLIEILVVIAIIGVVALAVTVAMSGAGGERQLEREGQRWQMIFDHACSEAELSGRDIGVWIDRAGYRFRRRHGAGWQTLISEGELRPRRWPENVQVQLLRDGLSVELDDMRTPSSDDATPAPVLRCLASGERTPFTLTLRLGELAWRIQAPEQGPLLGDWLENAR